MGGQPVIARVWPSAVSAPAADGVQLLDGKCGSESHIARGPIGADLTDAKYHVPYRCDAAVITAHPESGTVMIQFANKAARGVDAANILGFAGPPDADGMVRVQRIYIAGKPNVVTQAGCKLLYTGPKLTGIVCGGQVDAGGTRTVLVVAFNVK